MKYSIENIISGRLEDTPVGQTFLVEQSYPTDIEHGLQKLDMTASLKGIASCLNDPVIEDASISELCFLDTETSGLSGGTGTYPFLIGVGRFMGTQFQLSQFFMRDPGEEAAQLLALESYLDTSKILVTFNGKAFDVPLLNARYTLNSWKSPLINFTQIDLLHLARKLWRNHLSSRTLGNLEVEILGIQRSSDEVPGWMIPQLYFDYLRSGDARPLKNVFYHNAMDVLSMATLLDRIAKLILSPLDVDDIHKNELAAIGRIYEDLGDFEMAVRLYQQSLENMDHDEIYWDTLQRLSFIYKRASHHDQALELWRKAAQQGYIYAHIELAKHYEHRISDYANAIQWTEKAIDLIKVPSSRVTERITWLEELEHRLERLNRKQRYFN